MEFFSESYEMVSTTMLTVDFIEMFIIHYILTKLPCFFNTFFNLMHPGDKRSHPVFIRDGSREPIPGSLDFVVVQVQASQESFDLWKQNKFCWGQVRAVGWIFDHLDALFGKKNP